MTNLLSIPIKLTQEIQLVQPLLDFIQRYHHHLHSDLIKPDLIKLQSMRSKLISINSSSIQSLDSLIRYHAHLVHLINKLPKDVGIQFAYWSIFSDPTSTVASLLPGQLPASVPIQSSDLQFERACLLFNIAAISSSLAVSQPRSNVDQIKLAINYFQQASAALAYLRDHLILVFSSIDPISPDLSHHALTALENLTLAQAQECVWQKATMDNMRNGSISKVAQEVSRLYTLAYDSMTQARHSAGTWIGFSFPSDWIKHVNLKAAHFAAVAQYRKSCDDLAANDYGIEAGRLQEAISILKKAISSSKPDAEQAFVIAVKDAQSFLIKLQDTYQRARRDNDLIYLQPVPNASDLPPIKPVSMVKAVLPLTIQKPLDFLIDEPISGGPALGRPLLEAIVPYRVHRAIEVYEDRRDQHLKESIELAVQQADDQAIQALQLMNLPGSIQALERPINLPPSLIRNSEDLRNQDATRAMLTMLSTVEQASATNAETLEQITKSLDAEEQEDHRLRSEFGTHLWSLASSAQLNPVLRDREHQLRQTLNAASESDGVVKARHREWAHAIELLMQDEQTIRRSIPPPRSTDLEKYDLTAPTNSVQLSDPRRLRSLLDALEDLRIGRQAILDTARRAAAKDQIRELVLGHVAAQTDSAHCDEGLDTAFEQLFEEQLLKYDQFEQQCQANVRRQGELLEQIKTANQAFLDSRTHDPVTKARQDRFQELDLAYHKFYEIMNTLKEGLGFHHDFGKFLTQLRHESDRFVELRRAQAHDLHQSINAGLGLANLNFTPPAQAQSPGSTPPLQKQKQANNSNLGAPASIPPKKSKKDQPVETESHPVSSKPHADESEGPHRKIQPGLYDPSKHGPIRFMK